MTERAVTERSDPGSAGWRAIEYRLEPLYSYQVRIGAPQRIGPGPDGLRVFYPVDEGSVCGPRVRGRVLRGGGDWLTIRPDGVQVLDVRGVVETEDGALLYSTYTGVSDLGEDGYDRALRGELPRTLALRAAGRVHAADPRYVWLNRLQCLNVGEADTRTGILDYDVYALR